MPFDAANLEAQLLEFKDPILDVDLKTLKALKKIDVENQSVEIVLGYPLKRYREEYKEKIKKTLNQPDLKIDLHSKIESHSTQGLKAIPNIKNIIAVASGKGGVGKSTVAVNLAYALLGEGAHVGILDADIYGPSQPFMLGINKKPELNDEKKLLPVISNGLPSMSMGYLVEQNSAMIWRGPMVSMALQQLLNDTAWGELDYLIIDLPPGTGDIQLTLAQKIPVSGAVIVTTPQDLALLDVRRAYEMFVKVQVPVLGVVENMSTHICKQCGHEEDIFGHGGAEKLAKEVGISYLGNIPLDKTIREETDSGKPTVLAHPESENGARYFNLARKIAGILSLQGKDYSRKFPNIVVKNA